LGKDPRFLFSNDDKGRTEALAEYTRLITQATERSKQLFLSVPKARMEVRRVPECKQATSAGAYYQGGAMAGRRPGVCYAKLRDKTGMGEKEVTAEIERYIVIPGQACAYKVGMLKLQELRTRAQRELGQKFDQREFHDVVLKNGAMPLEILEEQVADYIQKKKS